MTSFKIENDTESEIVIIHEPEAFEFNLPPKKELEVETMAEKDSISISISSDQTTIYLSFWGHRSYYKLFYEGTEIFEEYYD